MNLGPPSQGSIKRLVVCIYERRRKFITKIDAISGMCLVLEVFQDTWRSNKENPSVYWGATLSSPLMALKLCKFVARSDLVPVSFWMLTIPWTF